MVAERASIKVHKEVVCSNETCLTLYQKFLPGSIAALTGSHQLQRIHAHKVFIGSENSNLRILISNLVFQAINYNKDKYI